MTLIGRQAISSRRWPLVGHQLSVSSRAIFQVSNNQIPPVPHGGQIAVQTEHQLPKKAQVIIV